MKRAIGVLVLLALSSPVWAQQSASFILDENTMNCGGELGSGSSPAGPTLSISMHAVGPSLIKEGMGSAKFQMEAGFSAGYLPPGAVRGLVFQTKDVLSWSPERTAKFYGVHRDLVSTLASLEYGHCLEAVQTTQTSDADVPKAGDAFFYLIKSINALHEQGILGFDSNGTARAGRPCA